MNGTWALRAVRGQQSQVKVKDVAMSQVTDSTVQTQDGSDAAAKPYAIIGEFADVDAVMKAAEVLRDSPYDAWDVHSPFPIHGINRAMGLRPTILPWIALVHGIIGAMVGLALVWWTNATTVLGIPTPLQGYEFTISGKPLFSLPANIPIIFELAILFAAFGTVLGMFGLNRLPMLANPLLTSERFRRVTDDGFFVVVLAEDPQFDIAMTGELLVSLGATATEIITTESGDAQEQS